MKRATPHAHDSTQQTRSMHITKESGDGQQRSRQNINATDGGIYEPTGHHRTTNQDLHKQDMPDRMGGGTTIYKRFFETMGSRSQGTPMATGDTWNNMEHDFVKPPQSSILQKTRTTTTTTNHADDVPPREHNDINDDKTHRDHTPRSINRVRQRLSSVTVCSTRVVSALFHLFPAEVLVVHVHHHTILGWKTRTPWIRIRHGTPQSRDNCQEHHRSLSDHSKYHVFVGVVEDTGVSLAIGVTAAPPRASATLLFRSSPSFISPFSLS